MCEAKHRGEKKSLEATGGQPDERLVKQKLTLSLRLAEYPKVAVNIGVVCKMISVVNDRQTAI